MTPLLKRTSTKRKVLKQRKNLLSFFLIMIQFCSIDAFSQSGDQETIEENQKVSRPAYLKVAVGFNSSSFRDFATSPLFYLGKPFYTALSHLDMNEKRDSKSSSPFS